MSMECLLSVHVGYQAKHFLCIIYLIFSANKVYKHKPHLTDEKTEI